MPLNVNDLVLIRIPYKSSAIDKVTNKFFHLYYDPYKISESYENSSYKLVHPLNSKPLKGAYNRESLKKYIIDNIESRLGRGPTQFRY